MPTLLVQLPGLPPVSHIVKEETTTIGRMKGNSIVIEDSSVSLMHAKITRKNGDYYLKDLNSTNGTGVNGQPVGEAKLKEGDRVRFAEISAQYLAEPSLEVLMALAAANAVSTVHPVATIPALPPAPTLSPAPVLLSTQPVSQPAPVGQPAISLQPLQGSPQIPVGGTTIIRMKPRPKARIGTLVAAGIGVLATLAVLSVLGFRLFEARGRQDQAANPPTAARPAAAEKPGLAGRTRNPESAPAQNTAGRPLSPQSAISDNPIELAILLKSHDVTQRRQAARSLHALGPEASKAALGLHEAVADADDEVRMWAALALVNTQQYDKRTVPILVHVLQNENSVLRQVACLSLGLVPYEDQEKELVVPALAETAGKDTDEDVRKAAKSALNILAPDLYQKPAK